MAASPKHATTSRLKILIVDDNEDAATALAMVLELDGHDAMPVYGSAEALETLQAFHPDVALLDIGMPDVDGYELAARLRKITGFEGLRLVAVTGYGRDIDKRRAQAAGFDAHLLKPVEPAALEAVLSRVASAAGAGARAV